MERISLGGRATVGFGDRWVASYPLDVSEPSQKIPTSACGESLAPVQSSGAEVGCGGVFRYEGLRLPVDGRLDGPSNLIIAASHRSFDQDLPKDIEDAVFVALRQETDPAKLRAFSQTLLPQYPVAASVLASQALALDYAPPPQVGTSGFNVLPKFVRREVQSVGKDLGKVAAVASVVPGVGLPTLLALQVASHPAGKIVKNTIGRIPVVHNVAGAVSKLSKSLPVQLAQKAFVTVHPALFGTMLLAGAGNEALQGEKLDKVLNGVRLQGGDWLKQEGALASLVPVIGTVLSPALTAAGALALGEPIPEAAIDIAAGVVPGGPIAQAAVKTGATFAVDLSKHEKLDVAALGAARTAAIAAGQAAGIPPQVVGSAFDLGMGLAQGKNLQKAGFGMASSLLKAEGGTIAEKALDAINLGGSDLVHGALGALKGALPPGAATMAKHAASTLIQNPAIQTSTQLATSAGVPEPVARAVLASVTREVVPGAPHAAPVLQPHVLNAILGQPSAPVSVALPPSVSVPPAPPAIPVSDPTPASASYGPYPSEVGVGRGGGHGGGWGSHPGGGHWGGTPSRPGGSRWNPTPGVPFGATAWGPFDPYFVEPPPAIVPMTPDLAMAAQLAFEQTGSYPATGYANDGVLYEFSIDDGVLVAQSLATAPGLGDPPPAPQPAGRSIFETGIEALRTASHDLEKEIEREIASVKGSVGENPQPTGISIKSIETPGYLRDSEAP
jgi:hypothetical protein